MNNYNLRKRRTFLVLAFISLALGLVQGIFYLQNDNREGYVENVSERVGVALAEMEKDLYKLKSIYKDKGNEDLRFGDVLKEFKYPIYLFNGNDLKLWSDNRYQFSYLDLAGFYVEKCIETSQGVFLLRKTTFSINGQENEMVSVLPLQEKYPLQRSYLKESLNTFIFPDSDVEITLAKTDFAVKTVYNSFLFSIVFQDNMIYHVEKQWAILVFCGLFFIFFYKYLRELIKYKAVKGNYFVVFFLLTIFLLSARGLMLYFNVPTGLLKADIFDSQVFYASLISPNLADLFLNLLVVLVILFYLFRNFGEIVPTTLWMKNRRYWRVYLIILVFAFNAYLVVYGVWNFYYHIYFDATFSLDITREIDVNITKIFATVIIFQFAVIFFILTHLLVRLISVIAQNRKTKLQVLLFGLLVVLVALYFFNILEVRLFTLLFVYLAILVYYNIPKLLLRINYDAALYLFFSAFVFCLISMISMFVFELGKQMMEKEKFASKLVSETDVFGEFFLHELSRKVGINQGILKQVYNQDNAIVDQISIGLIERQIKSEFEAESLDAYNLEIYLFDKNGQGINYAGTFEGVKFEKDESLSKTSYPDVFAYHDRYWGKKGYISSSELVLEGKQVGYLVLDLKLKRLLPGASYSSVLFLGENLEENFWINKYNYAVFQDGDLVFSNGTFNYTNSFLNSFQKGKSFEELNMGGFHHLFVSGIGGKSYIISSPIYPWGNFLSNFSFLFLLLILFIVSVIAFYHMFISDEHRLLDYSTKIQLYLNLAFFVPLLLVSIITVSVLSATKSQETEKYYLEKAQIVASELYRDMNNFGKKGVSIEQMGKRLKEISKFFQAEIAIFNPKGKLIVSSETYLYDNFLLSNLINPIVRSQLIEEKGNRAILNERLGSLPYSVVYVGVKSFDTGDVIGVISIPFFGSKYQFDKQIIDVLTTIINLFTIIFIVLLTMAHFAARSLTDPLKLITLKIKKTSLSGYNDPLDYEGDDELGLMVGEYNKMLDNLEQNKKALARGQKELAWREIAKQVAHEIKNPLTPMKLSLQQLKRVFGEEERVKKMLNMLLVQVDTLDDIASSFSSFAKMPVPKEEEIDIAMILRQAVNLYERDLDDQVSIEKHIPSRQLLVLADSKLMGRIFGNLILNGFQSIPADRTPKIKVTLLETPTKVKILFQDNGSGIPEAIRSKVFLPNFTTKETGSGVGLAISKRGIEHLGGNIWFETNENGTTFFIEMPLI